MFTSRSIYHKALALHATFDSPDVTTISSLGDLGLRVASQHIEPGKAVLECVVVAADGRCRRCQGVATAVPRAGMCGGKTPLRPPIAVRDLRRRAARLRLLREAGQRMSE